MNNIGSIGKYTSKQFQSTIDPCDIKETLFDDSKKRLLKNSRIHYKIRLLMMPYYMVLIYIFRACLI